MVESTRHYVTGNTYPVKDQLKQLGCRWDTTQRSWYAETAELAAKAQAVVPATPLYNSPPPQDLGTADPVALAAKFGRRAIGGATVLSFTVYGLGKGDNGKPNGSIRVVRGVRYVQVGRTARRYLSRDCLEDMDLFNAKAGGSYQWDGVAVESTDEEAAADAAAQAKRDSEAAAEVEARAKIQAGAAARMAAWQAAIAGLEVCTAPPESYLVVSGTRLTIDPKHEWADQITLADGSSGWRRERSAYDDYRTYFYFPRDVARTVRLAYADANGYTLEASRAWLAQYAGCYGDDIHGAVVERG